MKRFSLVLLSLVACAREAPIGPIPPLTTAAPPPEVPKTRMSDYPATRRDPTSDVLFGTKVDDPYRWLEDEKSDETRAWVKAEDDFARAKLHAMPERDAIAARLKELYYVDVLGIPSHHGDRYFWTQRKSTDEKSIVYVKDGKKGKERVLLDPNGWSKDGSVSLGGWSPSHDGRFVAYSVKANNSDEATLHLLDVTTGKERESDRITGAKYAYPSWTPTNDGFYYVWLPTDPKIPVSERPGYAELRFHKLGTDPAKDPIIRERTNDPTMFLSGGISHDGHWLFHTLSLGWTSERVFFRDMRKKDAPWVELAPGREAHYDVNVWKDRFYVLTDEGASRKRVFMVDPAHPERDAWKEILPEPKDESITSLAVRGGKLALTYLKNATGRLEIRGLDGKLEHEVALPGVGSVSGIAGRPDDDEAWFSYTSYTEPWTSFALDLHTAKTSLHSQVKVPFDPSPFTTTQVFYPSKDGTRVSMFIVHRKDLPKGKAVRTLLYGYGGFQVDETPYFNSSIVPWLERGGIWAVANLRGGSEYGEAWHQGGMRDKKQNVFDDFIGAAEYLIREGYTDSSRLAIHGGSNGGLLVGAVMTQRPELYAAVLCAVPLLDMVRYHKFGSGKTWISEYGSADDEAGFRWLHAYSPYHHVKEGTRYPSLLMLAADSDDRVDPMHARKFVAAVQNATTGGEVLLRVEKNSGHGGADLRKAEVEKGADQYAFALAHTKP